MLLGVTSLPAHGQPVLAQPGAGGTAIRVGPTQKFTSIAEAARAARVGDTIEIEAGDYVADVVVLETDLVRIIGVGGRPRLRPGLAHAEGKGTFVIRARGVEIENLQFIGARAPDHYGSAIRLESGSLRVVNSKFEDNELAIMTANDSSIVLEVVGCEFSGLRDNVGRGEALAHSLYAGSIDTLRVEASYFRRGNVGHLIKSRARNSYIRYNRLTDEDGISSYELEFPEGGNAVVVGNLIQQGRHSENSTIVSYGAEGLRWKENALNALFNTVVNDSAGAAIFFSVRSPAAMARVRYNVLVGSGNMNLPPNAEVRDNVRAATKDFVDASSFDYRPRWDTKWVGSATALEYEFPKDLVPRREYRHAAGTKPLARGSRLVPVSPGAIQSLGP